MLIRVVLVIKLPVVCRNVDLITGAAPQILESVLLRRGTDLNSLPITEFGFVMDRVTVDRRVVGGMRAQLHRQGVCGSCGKSDLRRMRGSCT